ncbi:PEP-CTERM sorting domain-containing protein [Aeoliella straminimaris]
MLEIDGVIPIPEPSSALLAMFGLEGCGSSLCIVQRRRF